MALLACMTTVACEKVSDASKCISTTVSPPESTVSHYPDDLIEWVYKDSYAKEFIEKCLRSRPIIAAGTCEHLLYTERAKQVWAAEIFEDTHAVVTEEGSAKKGDLFQIAMPLDADEVEKASQQVRNKFHREEEWMSLADIYKLSERDREIVKSAITRDNAKRFDMEMESFELTIPEDRK